MPMYIRRKILNTKILLSCKNEPTVKLQFLHTDYETQHKVFNNVINNITELPLMYVESRRVLCLHIQDTYRTYGPGTFIINYCVHLT